VKLQLSNHTRLVAGGHQTTDWINRYMNARLKKSGSRDFGSAFESVWIQLLYPDKDRTKQGAPGFAELVAIAPRVKVLRAKHIIKIDMLCPKVPPRSIVAAGHLSPKQVEHVFAAILAALQLVRPKLRRNDDFDFSAFLDEMQAIIANCRVDIGEELESS
jgi:hypothetical protein